jgi:hypothetical protein
MKILIGKFNIEVKDALSWYDTKEIEASYIGGAKMTMQGTVPTLSGIEGDIMFRAKLKLFELVILNITENEKTIPYSIDWLKTLSPEEGILLETTLDGIYSAEKKN